MKTYREWSPTTFDIKGLNLPDQQDWLVLPVLVTRDTPEGSIDNSNFLVAKERLTAIDPNQEDWERHSFNHWACGHFEILIARPGSACAQAGEEIESALQDYAILDEMDWSQREHEAMCESWKALSVRDRAELIRRKGNVSIFAARRAEIPDDYAIEETLRSWIE